MKIGIYRTMLPQYQSNCFTNRDTTSEYRCLLLTNTTVMIIGNSSFHATHQTRQLS